MCRSLSDANEAFKQVPKPTVFTWNAIISAHLELARGHSPLLLYRDMKEQNVKPNRVTFLYAIKACVNVQDIVSGRQIHHDIILTEICFEICVLNALIDMYSKSGSLSEALNIFDGLQSMKDVVSWSTLITGYAQHGGGLSALSLYEQMLEQGVKPEKTIFSSILKACGSTGSIEEGMLVHDHINKAGSTLDTAIGGALIDMYVRCGEVNEARCVFDLLPNLDMISWSTMISGYVQYGHGSHALQLFVDMQHNQVETDRATYLCVLKACIDVGDIEAGRLVHEQLIIKSLEADQVLGNALVDMYACFSNMEDAWKVFGGLSNPDVVSWTAIISGYAERGESTIVKQSLKSMKRQGLELDGMIFMSILSVCAHGGLLSEGCDYFNSMIEIHSVTPTVEHYNCMVDLLGHAGFLDEAQALLSTMPLVPDVVGLTSLLSGRKVYNNGVLVRPYIFEVSNMTEDEDG